MTFQTGVYSQSHQDQLLDFVFNNIGTRNRVPFCVEFGFNSTSLTHGSGSNTARLILDKHWQSLLLDGEHDNPQITLHRHFLTSSNICDVFRLHNVPREPEYISIDVDSTDLWLFDALLHEYRAMLFSVEYNAHFPLHAAITFPNDSNERWEGDRGYGASLKALNSVAARHGYSLLWVVPALDAFFIRNDLIDDGSGQICFPLEYWEHCTGVVCHRPLRNRDRAGLFIDYDVYMDSGGDIDRSRRSAFPVCNKYLVGTPLDRMTFTVKSMIPGTLAAILKGRLVRTRAVERAHGRPGAS